MTTLLTYCGDTPVISARSFWLKFLDLLKLHRENVQEVQIENKTQRSVFVILRSEFQDLYEIVKKNASSKYKNKYDYAQIAYTLLYFGIGETSTPMVKALLSKYDIDIINKIISEVGNYRKPKGYKRLKHLRKFELDNYYPFNGHQSRLGHYFRHIFQTIKYIDNQSYLSLDQQKFYAKILRSQLSNQEIAIFFYNSLSPLGKIWYDPISKDKKNLSFMQKYEMIKNLPLDGFTYELNPKEKLEIDYEWDHIHAIPMSS